MKSSLFYTLDRINKQLINLLQKFPPTPTNKIFTHPAGTRFPKKAHHCDHPQNRHPFFLFFWCSTLSVGIRPGFLLTYPAHISLHSADFTDLLWTHRTNSVIDGVQLADVQSRNVHRNDTFSFFQVREIMSKSWAKHLLSIKYQNEKLSPRAKYGSGYYGSYGFEDDDEG